MKDLTPCPLEIVNYGSIQRQNIHELSDPLYEQSPGGSKQFSSKIEILQFVLAFYSKMQV